jgi:acetyltransferase-like isoleucine patch superfamily enzyme
MAEAAFLLVPPFTLSRLRVWVLRACGVRIGFASFVWGAPSLIGPGSIAARLRIGSHCGFNDGCLFDLAAPITFGDHVSVGHQVRFIARRDAIGGSHPDVEGRPAPIVVGDGAWIAARCTIMGGVSIGAGSVIGAGTTITQDVPPQTLVTGSQTLSLAKWR